MRSCEKILRKMRRSSSGWGQRDFETLYIGFGFEYNEGANHRTYYHPKYPELMATVARHNELAKGYAEHAIDVIGKLKRLEAKERKRQANAK